MNKPENILDFQSLGYLGGSDHKIITIDFLFGSSTAQSTEQVYDWKNANQVGLQGYLSGIQWNEVLNEQPVEVQWDTFKEVLNTGMTQFVPLKQRSNPNSPPTLV